jgi:hypothetical protein
LKRIVGDSASESNDPYDLNRFISAQQGVYDRALADRVRMQSRMLMSRVQNNMRQGPEHALPEMS